MKRLRLSLLLWQRGVWHWILAWLTREGPPHEIPLYDFPRLVGGLKPGDVVLVEGRSRIATIIRVITQSQWSHSALYLGRLADIADASLRHLVAQYYQEDDAEPLLVESLMGEGTRVSPLKRYRHDHLRVCRPKGLCPDDAQQVMAYAIRRLGTDYDIRQILDLARFFLPVGVLPRRWRSSLFSEGDDSARIVCSRLLAEAFDAVGYPVLPFMDRRDDGTLHFFRRNPRLFTPKDFDYSPFFEVLKFPPAGLSEPGVYRGLNWSLTHIVYSDAMPGGFRAALGFALASGPAEAEEDPRRSPATPGRTPRARRTLRGRRAGTSPARPATGQLQSRPIDSDRLLAPPQAPAHPAPAQAGVPGGRR